VANADDDVEELLPLAAAITDRESEERWDIVRHLHERTDLRTFEAASVLAQSHNLQERVLGLDILAQVGYRAGRPFVEETLPVVLEACEDHRWEVLDSAIAALGHLGDIRGVPAVVRHAGHPSEEVRFAVAVALPSVAGDSPGDDVVAALIRLSQDVDGEVRDWATMGLASSLDVDDPVIRDALAARLDDDEGDTAGEALLGLARRKDQRALAPLLAWLDDQPGNLIVEAAAALGSSQALPALLQLKAEGWEKSDPRPSVLDDAIRACSR
jgi:HEAT repeat protein